MSLDIAIYYKSEHAFVTELTKPSLNSHKTVVLIYYLQPGTETCQIWVTGKPGMPDQPEQTRYFKACSVLSDTCKAEAPLAQVPHMQGNKVMGSFQFLIRN